ncbi:hypothetical protein [Psychrobacter sp. I-STPA10]|uniref:hypothetical protein n=1 Tax=Psychrobacter sp. I-STPA10 TaxID=2585769 RepID=UPI001E3B0CC0|nr:hypothetical protein [Psychrobacter sp. I-STPA10]
MSIATLMVTIGGCSDPNRESDEYIAPNSDDLEKVVEVSQDVTRSGMDGAYVDPAIESTQEVVQYLSVPSSSEKLEVSAWQTKVQSPHCLSQPVEPTSLTSETLAPVTLEKTQHGALSPCIKFELNTLDFSPSQPWLSNIMWQTIAYQAVPDKTLSSEGGSAKIAVRMMLRQIKGLQTSAINLPIYQYINTEFAINKNDTGYLKIDSVQQRFEHSPRLNYIYYKMVDMSQQRQLTLSDILDKNYNKEALLALLQRIPKASQSGLEPVYHLPVDLPAQWYMDDLGLHLLYQPGEMIEQTLDIYHTDKVLDNNNLNEIIELVVPYEVINNMLKPQYQVGKGINVNIDTINNTGDVSHTDTVDSDNNGDGMGIMPIIVKQLAYE